MSGFVKSSFAKSTDFNHVVQAYKDLYDIDLSNTRMKWSKHPVYNDGKRSYDFADDETGGSWVDDGTVRINPNMGPVLKRFGIEGMTQAEFRRRIIAHELAHEVWHNQSRKAKVKKLIKDVLAEARKKNFTTPYLDTYSPDTPKKKFDSELFAEYMSDQLNKKAQKAFDSLTADRIGDISKSASSNKETYESGEGEVESYTPDKTEDHDEIVLRLKSGKKLVISNNTRLGVRVKPDEGDEIGHNGYRIDGTNVVHRVHPNRRSRGGWLERLPSET